MKDPWLEKWNERYRQQEYAFGKEPNAYLKGQLVKFPPGNILFPAEGEGRNAVFAASLGWRVSAFDISIEGRNKAIQLAKDHHVTINYEVGELTALKYRPGQFDAIALIYAHFPADIKSKYHKLLDTYLRKGGVVIFEAFSKKHLAYKRRNEMVGGPGDLDTLFSIEEIASDFSNYEVLELAEQEIDLSEGHYHNGTGSVIRFAGRKK